ncbi:DUF6879 family protein [Streptomyces sp. Amel2xC10]|uniref:DUF6879 family protein n=1 Tax=Streptomyces sp. Amel2xC10 TaxID=1305826 RepID=UPI000A088493|nr:DUF6879 family protein [Streptomyces sp. Amel2xC10]SMF23539.1 hypothetical protein SAMN02745830_02383 [Streptomyces sp. Amel2xC10]
MPSSVPTFAELLDGCQRSAVHLELRDAYAPTERFEAWQRGERVDWADRASWWDGYLQKTADTVARGVAIRRARIVSEPVSEYIRWEHEMTRELVEAGEDVRWLPRRRTTDLGLPGNDFWLFDDRLVRVHHFDGDGAVVEDEFTEDPVLIKHLSAAFEAVWERAVPHVLYSV